MFEEVYHHFTFFQGIVFLFEFTFEHLDRPHEGIQTQAGLCFEGLAERDFARFGGPLECGHVLVEVLHVGGQVGYHDDGTVALHGFLHDFGESRFTLGHYSGLFVFGFVRTTEEHCFNTGFGKFFWFFFEFD